MKIMKICYVFMNKYKSQHRRSIRYRYYTIGQVGQGRDMQKSVNYLRRTSVRFSELILSFLSGLVRSVVYVCPIVVVTSLQGVCKVSLHHGRSPLPSPTDRAFELQKWQKLTESRYERKWTKFFTDTLTNYSLITLVH